ncbi:MAG: family 10 glycosylhydrolase [Tannerellaceae bacterium]|nr:family 10 glycosylhydrolase [Tannerellaceae bacterium]
MKTFKLSFALLVIVTIISCAESKKTVVKESEYPLFWTWLDYRPGMNFDSVCVVMTETGIDGMMLNAPTPDDYRKVIPVAHAHGIEVYAWLWTMNLEHGRDSIVKAHPEWLSVNRKGESLANHTAYVGYYKFMCPALPEVHEYIKDKVKTYCEVEGLNGIAIDYHRLVDVVLPTTLWPKYGIVQDKEYPEWDYGYHPAMIEKFQSLHGYDPREQEDPSMDEKWLQFRCDQITEVANEIADVVHSYGKKMAASPFPTPAMSRRMVRQDWGKWNLDIVFPMVYHNFYTEDVSFISDCTIENVKEKNPNTTLYCGMMASNGPEMFELMDAALNNGAEGVSIFTIGGLRNPELRASFKAYADSVRAQRAQSPVNPAATGVTEVTINPFEKLGIMKLINQRIAKYISDSQNSNVVEIELGEYKLTDEYGATKCYNVTELVNKQSFDVTFYFYGGILSGWNVEPHTNK